MYLDVLARHRPGTGHLRHRLRSEAVEAPEDAALPCCHLPLAMNLLGRHPQSVEERHRLSEDGLEG